MNETPNELFADTAYSVEATPPQVVGDDDVGDGVEHELDVGRVGGARHVAVDLLRGRLVLRLELRLDVGRRLAVLLRASVLREADGERRLLDLLLEQVLLVEEEDDGGVGEPLVVANRVEQLQRLLHAVLVEGGVSNM